jgi:hypothetical protein
MNTPQTPQQTPLQVVAEDDFRFNPESPVVLRVLILVSCILLAIVGSTLIFFPEVARTYWVWKLTPFNTRFLGAVYLGSLTPLLVALIVNRWSPTRIVLPMLCVFTTLALMVTGNYADVFNWNRRATGIWFGLYSMDAVGSAYYLWRYRYRTPATSSPTSNEWRTYLWGQGVVLGSYGIGLILFPKLLSAFWPWKLDAFHSQFYSAAFLSGAIGTFLLTTVAAPLEWLTLGLTQAFFSWFAIMGTVLTDRVVHKIQWSALGTWLWIGALMLLGLAGLGMIWQSSRQE